MELILFSALCRHTEQFNMPTWGTFTGGFGNVTIRQLLATYIVTRSSLSVDEGSSVTFTVTTTNVPNGAVLYYTLNIINGDASDVTATSGSFTITNGVGSFSVTTVEDLTTEGSEYITASIRTSSINGPIVATSGLVLINDTSQEVPTYTMTPSATTINEGEAVVFSVTTTGVIDGSRLYWEPVSGAHVIGNTPGGNFVISGGAGSFQVIASLDKFTSGTETFTIRLRSGQFGGQVAIETITVLDTSTEEFTIVTVSEVVEGQTLNVELIAEMAPDDHVYYWTVSRPEDFQEGSGSVTINPGGSGIPYRGYFTLSVLGDASSEGPETFTISIRRDSTSGEIAFTSDPITISEPAGFSFSPNDAFFDSAVEVRIGWTNEDDYNAFSGFLNAAKEGEMTISTVGGNFTNFNSSPPADAGFSSINATFSTPTTTQTFGNPTDFWRIIVPISYTNPIDPDPFGADSIEIPITIQASSSLNENELTDVSWSVRGSGGFIELLFEFSNGAYSTFQPWAQANAGGTFIVRYNSVNYYITFSAISNNADYGNGTGFVGFDNRDGPNVSMTPDIPENINNLVPVTWLKFYAPAQLQFFSDTLVGFSRDPDIDFEAGTTVLTFSSDAAAETFATNLSTIGTIRANAVLCGPYISQQVNIDVNPSGGGIASSITVLNSEAASATASGSTVTLSYVNSASNGPTNGSGQWIFKSQMTYVDNTSLGSITFSGGNATLTLPSSVAESLVAELAAGGRLSYGAEQQLSINTDIGGGQQGWMIFEGVTNLAGTGNQITFNYVSEFNDGDFGPPFLLITSS